MFQRHRRSTHGGKKRSGFYRGQHSQLQFEMLESRCLLSGTPLESIVAAAAGSSLPTTEVPAQYGKIGPALTDLSKSIDGSLYGMSRANLESFLQIRGNDAAVEITAAGDPSLLVADLQEKLGIGSATVYGDKVQAWLPLSVADQLNSWATVKTVGLLTKPITNIGTATSQGDDAQRTDVLRSYQRSLPTASDTDLTGKGVTVGVISDSYDLRPTGIKAAADISTGDLPGVGNPIGNTQPVTVYRDNHPVGTSQSDEGRAMLQIVHDVAPGAKLVFSNDADASGIQSQEAFAQNITALWQTQGAKIIVDDLVYYAEPMFSEGVIAQAARQAVEAGIVYVSAAGNQAAVSYESVFRPGAGVVPIQVGSTTYNVVPHDFDASTTTDIWQQIVVPANASGNPTIMSFQWDQPFGAASTNFEFFVRDMQSGAVGKGTQLNALNPVEIVSINNLTGVPRNYEIAIGVNGALPSGNVNLKYIAFKPDVQIFEYATNSPSAFGHVLANGVIGVGAAEFWETPEFGAAQPTVAAFSSLGPIGGVDIVAPQRGNTTFFGVDSPQDADALPNFPGTSAAAPHIAGVAALLLQANPLLTPAGMLAAIQSSAIDMDDPLTPLFDTGIDGRTGAGLVDALGAIGVVQNVPQLKNLAPNQYILVNTTSDTTSISGSVSLRGAVMNANLTTSTQKTILVPGGAYILDLAGTGGDNQGDLDIAALVTIVGAGAGASLIYGNGPVVTHDRVFDVSSGGTLNLIGATVTGGQPTGASGNSGGGILVRDGGTLNLSYAAVVGNSTPDDGGGGIYFERTGGGTITNSVITDNTASGFGGGVSLHYPSATSTAPSAAVIVSNSIIAKNTGTGNWADIVGEYDKRKFTSLGNNLLSVVPSSGAGAGFTNGVNNDRVSSSVNDVVTDIGDNIIANDSIARSLREAIQSANSGGGEIWVPGWRFRMTIGGSGGVTQGDFDVSSSMTVRGVGAGETIIDASPLKATAPDRVFEVLIGAVFNLIGATVTGGQPTGASGISGGGILVRDGGTLNLTNSAIVGNSTPSHGGGGIYFERFAGGSITNSVITNNIASGYGGGIELQYPSETPGQEYAPVAVANSIIAKNTGTGEGADIIGDYNVRQFTSLGNNLLSVVPSSGAGFTNGVNNDLVSNSVNYVVTGVADTYDGSSDVVVMSLRDAVHLANVTAGAQETWVPAWSVKLTRSGTGLAESGDLDITSDVTIIGAGAGATVIDAGPLMFVPDDRIFDVAASGVLKLKRVTLQLGQAGYVTGERNGGGVRVQDDGQFDVTQSAILGNVANSNGQGGGIYFAGRGRGSIVDCVITVNESANDQTGGVYLAAAASQAVAGQVIVKRSIIAKNQQLAESYYPDVFAGTNRTFSSGLSGEKGDNRIGNWATGFSAAQGDMVGTPDYIVTSVVDTYDGTSDKVNMSLRDAVHQANITAGTQEIWLPAWKFVLTRQRNVAWDQPEMDVDWGDIEFDQSTIIRGINGPGNIAATRVDWMAGATADKVFELVGDYNGDWSVGPVDQNLAQNFNPAADGNDDGEVNSLDYNLCVSHDGNTLQVEFILGV